MYDDVLSCLDVSLPYTRLADVSDWYLSMIFDYDIALNISEDMCSGWESTYTDRVRMNSFFSNILNAFIN